MPQAFAARMIKSSFPAAPRSAIVGKGFFHIYRPKYELFAYQLTDGTFYEKIDVEIIEKRVSA